MMAEHHLLAEFEDKSEAIELIDKTEKVNKRDPRIWAMRAVVALLAADEAKAQECRAKARAGREQDPNIDYLIGHWMASRMRYSECVPYLRKSLEIDSNYLPAQISLGQNLLRVGEEEEAWDVLESVYINDQYNVAVYNLLALHDEIKDYKIINRKNFIVRMEEKEAALFGDRVLNLLEKAERELHAKYAFTPSKPILVEFFPNQEDFAVRTLGFMGADGLLGACFGLVVTMNSPNSTGAGKSNWESTLWHEYCHAVTLGATKNRMPRWLTEGISVYEERRRDPACGEKLDAEYRHMILEGEELIPLNRLNYGFLRPKSGKHMLFAYYQSSMFVEYFVENFGEEKLTAILVELREGVPFSEACKKHAKALAKLEKEFFAFSKKTAEDLGKGLDWKLPEENLAALSLEKLEAWLKDHPNNFYALRAYASALLSVGLNGEAKPLLEKIIENYPEHVQSGSPYRMLAEVYKRTGEPEKEREQLWTLVSQSTDWLDEMLYLLNAEAKAENWNRAFTLADKIMAVNPYITTAQRLMAQAHEALARPEEAVATYEKLLSLRPNNPAQIHYQVARLTKESQPHKAKRHTLDALAEAPRYREALSMLLELQDVKEKVEPDPFEEPSAP